jgi:hypothetical protein
MTIAPPADTNDGSPPRMRTEPPSYDGRRPTTEPIRKASSIARRIGGCCPGKAGPGLVDETVARSKVKPGLPFRLAHARRGDGCYG